MSAQSFTAYTSTEGNYQQKGKASMSGKAKGDVVLEVDKNKPGTTFKSWGTCMNELGWDAMNLLKEEERNHIMDMLYTKEGLGYTMARITMNANDYSRNNYSCDSVPGDFQLRYFNINRDKQATIPFCKAALQRCPEMTFWMSPWSPPSWMKINNHYAVQSSKYNDLDPRQDYLLFGDEDRSVNEQVNPGGRIFPRRLATQNFFIMEPHYLQAYADMFSRFIDEYKKEGINIGMVMYQNEAYSYTPYPGCPWTVEGIQKFNLEYLKPTLQKKNPDVKLWLGTFNTNRFNHVMDILKDPRCKDAFVGLGFQWEGRQIMRRIKEAHPYFEIMCTESECGNGRFDWHAAEHTFYLMTEYLGAGCTSYTFWNTVLCDNGQSPWGWRQNALVQVNSKERTYRFAPEYYSVWHFAHFVRPGSKLLGAKSVNRENPVNAVVYLNPQGKYVVMANNPTNEQHTVSVKIGKKYLNLNLKPHSLNTYQQK